MQSEQQSGHKSITLVHNILFMLAAFYMHAYIYEIFIFPFWEYRQFKLEPDNSRLIQALLSVAIFAILMPKSLKKASDLYVILIAYFFVSSNAALYVKAALPTEVFLSTFLAATLIASVRGLPVPRLPNPGFQVGFLLSAILIFCLFSAVRTVSLQGFDIASIDFLNVEERRFSAREAITGLDAYLTTYGQQLSVMGFIVSIFFRKRLFALLYSFLVITFFVFVGQKSFIFIAVFSSLIVIFLANRINYLIFSLIALMMIFLVVDSDSSIGFYLGSLIFRRISYAPAILNESYLSYFSENGFIYWGYSKIGLGIVPYVDELSPAFRIGEVLYPGTQAHANTGIIGSGYMNAGYAGIAIYALILGFMCAFLDKLGFQTGNERLIATLCAPQLFLATTTSDLPGMVLSAGLGTAILVSWLLPNSFGVERANENRNSPELSRSIG